LFGVLRNPACEITPVEQNRMPSAIRQRIFRVGSAAAMESRMVRTDPPAGKPTAPAPRDTPPLHLDEIKVKARNFR